MDEQDKELAIKCRLITSSIQGIYVDTLQEFADLIRADEREACINAVWQYPGISLNDRLTAIISIKARGSK